MANGKTEYTGDVGTFLLAGEATKRRNLFKTHGAKAHKAVNSQVVNPSEMTQAEFFGRNRINQLMNQKECVGIRIYYGFRWEDADGNPTSEGKGELRPRLLLVGTRADGSDIFENPMGLKDADEGDNKALGDGLPCPKMCSP